MAGITVLEQRRLVRSYLGVVGGYLGKIDNISVLERFLIDCGLEVNPRELGGTNCNKFEEILKNAPPVEQAAIIRGALRMHPPDTAECSSRTKGTHDELIALADRLEGASAVASKKPAITSSVVERAIDDAERLMETTGATSAVDRLHTMLHGYLRAVCEDAGIPYTKTMMMSGLFGLIRSQHPAFTSMGPRKDEIQSILRSLSGIMDAMNPLRNEASLAHPNKDLLDTPEASLVINAARTILHYIDSKVSACTV